MKKVKYAFLQWKKIITFTVEFPQNLTLPSSILTCCTQDMTSKIGASDEGKKTLSIPLKHFEKCFDVRRYAYIVLLFGSTCICRGTLE